MEHLWWDLGEIGATALFEVKLRGSQARVSLMDADAYQAYLDSDAYEFHGGFTDVSPVHVQVPYDDHWYLVVDSYPNRIKVWVSQVFD